MNHPTSPRSARRPAATLTLAATLGLGGLLAGVAPWASAQSTPATPPARPASASDIVERGVTKPKQEPKLVFYGAGVVANILVEEGQPVKKDQVLAEQDSREEQAMLDKLAGDLIIAELQIQASEADVKQKRVDLRRKEDLHKDLLASGRSNVEVDEARVAVEIGDIAVKYRGAERDKTKIEIKAAELKRDLRKLTSPVDGIVSKIDVKVGEGCDLSKAVMQVVASDTLLVEVDVPTARAKQLKVGDSLQVAYADDREKWMTAKITVLSPYANAASGTRKVRLEMVNEAQREAGLAVYVRLPDNATAAK